WPCILVKCCGATLALPTGWTSPRLGLQSISSAASKVCAAPSAAPCWSQARLRRRPQRHCSPWASTACAASPRPARCSPCGSNEPEGTELLERRFLLARELPIGYAE